MSKSETNSNYQIRNRLLLMVTSGADFDKPSLASLGNLGKKNASHPSAFILHPFLKDSFGKRRLSLKSLRPWSWPFHFQGCECAQNNCSFPGFGLRMFVQRRRRVIDIASIRLGPARRASRRGNE